ncbi:MAG: sulfatase [Fidelibacterota bacterium]|nr:MAG: sulfatase [Candidatus Neomarinimicrobiota bacterium]
MPSERSANKQPNLLFVFADQMRGQAMGCAGNGQVITPNLDRLASEGLRFTNAISTYPVCCPTRASLMTGKYPLSHGIITNGPPLPDTELCIGDMLKSAGYQTGYIGKWHLNGHLSGESQFVPPGPKRHGFDYWAAVNMSHDYFNSFYYTDTDKRIPIKGWEPDTQTDLAIRYLEEHREGSPFCLFLSWGPPHDPYIAPEKYLKLYPPEKIELRENVFLADRSIIATYYAAVTSLDWNMGRLLEALDRLGLAENTVVVFTSDHGEQLFSLYLFHKQWPYEETIQVPFILRYPGKVAADEVTDLLMGTPDILPTMLGLMDIDVPSTVEGKDLSAFILGTAAEPEPDSLLIEVINPCAVVQDRAGMRAWRGVRTKRHTFARFRDEDWLLIDNKYDPYQRRNLIYNTEYQSLRDELNEKLEVWLKETNDPFLPAHAYQRYEMVRNRPPLYKAGD